MRVVKIIIIKILYRLFVFSNKIKLKLRNYSWETNQNINIEQNNSIHISAELIVNLGGSISIGNNNEILNNVLLMTYGGNIEIGNGCSINPFTIIYGHGGVKIGDDVLIAGHCMLIPSNHNFNNIEIPISKQGSTNKGIIIENNVWIAHGCTILDGVKISSGSIIGAGSVVSKDVPPNSIVVGIPAKVIKTRLSNYD